MHRHNANGGMVGEILLAPVKEGPRFIFVILLAIAYEDVRQAPRRSPR
jgi:hypothetical protein